MSQIQYFMRGPNIEIDCHFIFEKILLGDVTTKFVNSNYQFVDVFTKSLQGLRTDYIWNKFGAYDLQSLAWGVLDVFSIYRRRPFSSICNVFLCCAQNTHIHSYEYPSYTLAITIYGQLYFCGFLDWVLPVCTHHEPKNERNFMFD